MNVCPVTTPPASGPVSPVKLWTAIVPDEPYRAKGAGSEVGLHPTLHIRSLPPLARHPPSLCRVFSIPSTFDPPTPASYLGFRSRQGRSARYRAIISRHVLVALVKESRLHAQDRVYAAKGTILTPLRTPGACRFAVRCLEVKTVLVLVLGRRWHIYSISYATTARAAKVILRTLEVSSDPLTHILQIIAIPVNLESWAPNSFHEIDSSNIV